MKSFLIVNLKIHCLRCIILPPFLNISHIVFSTNINARLGEVCGTEEKKKITHAPIGFPSSLDPPPTFPTSDAAACRGKRRTGSGLSDTDEHHFECEYFTLSPARHAEGKASAS